MKDLFWILLNMVEVGADKYEEQRTIALEEVGKLMKGNKEIKEISMNYVQSCSQFVERLSELDADEPLSAKDQQFFVENRFIIIPLMKDYSWDEGFYKRLLALPLTEAQK